MRKSCLVALLVSLMFASPVLGASYEKTDGEIIDPIWCRPPFDIDVVEGCPPGDQEAVHLYRGPNLAPDVETPNADLEGANLNRANLTNANLSDAYLSQVDFSEADLSGAFLISADLQSADLSGTDLRGADLTGTLNLGFTLGIPEYDAWTDFNFARIGDEDTSLFDPVAAGWVLVPEPSATLLAAGALMTLAGLAVGKRLA